MRRFVVASLSLVVLAGCSFTAYSHETMLRDLKQQGISVNEKSERISSPLFGEGYAVKAAGQEIQTYTYSSAFQANAAAGSLNANGEPTKDMVWEWKGSAHVYRKDNLVALYVGEDKSLLQALRAVMGKPIAEGKGK